MKKDEVRPWLIQHERKGMDLHDLALGLCVERGMAETYDSLQKIYQKNGWRIPSPRRERGYRIVRDYDTSTGVRVKKTAAVAVDTDRILDDLAALWNNAKDEALWQSAVEAECKTSDQGTVYVDATRGITEDPSVRPFFPVHIPQDGAPSVTSGGAGDLKRSGAESSKPDGVLLEAEGPDMGTVHKVVVAVLEQMGIKKPMERPVFKHEIEGLPDSATIAVLGDQHIPYHDPSAMIPAIQFVRDVRPDYVVINGDMIDAKGVGKFDRGMWGEYTVAQELEQGRRYLDILRKAAPDAEILFVPGNHEARIAQYLRLKAPELEDLEEAQLHYLLRFEDFGVKLKDQGFKENFIRFDGFHIGHWNKAYKYGGYTAKNLMADFACSFVQAHVHRLAMHHRTYMMDEFVGIEAGCLCKLAPEFTLRSDWQHGFVFVHKIGRKYFPQTIKITDGEFVFDGHLWTMDDGKREDGVLDA